MVDEDKEQVSGMIDWGCSGYFPAYWEWLFSNDLAPVTIRMTRLMKILGFKRWNADSDCMITHKERQPGSWSDYTKLFGRFTQWALTPEARRMNRGRGWAEVCDNI